MGCFGAAECLKPREPRTVYAAKHFNEDSRNSDKNWFLMEKFEKQSMDTNSIWVEVLLYRDFMGKDPSEYLLTLMLRWCGKSI